ncbi:MAG: hypothetical protein DMG57_21095 [Acidobacteria bacterium]|nr:MAG: hypothetical protein DMG57_21095 [Acidobacteriota bacterium]
MDNLENRRNLQATAISARHIAQILERAMPTHVLTSFELLNGGASNLSYQVRFDGMESPFVLRVYTRDPPACQKEVDILNFISRQLPVPDPIYADPKGEDDVGPYLLYRYAEGMTLRFRN